MKTMMKPLGILFALTLLLAGCGGGSSSAPAPQPPGALEVGGGGLTLDETADDQGGALLVNFSLAVDVNDANDIIGYAEVTQGADFVAALWSVDTNGGVTVTARELSPLTGNSFSAAFALDDNGNAVGQSAAGAQLVAVIWEAGSSTPTALPALAAGNSKAFGISADGSLIVGEAQEAGTLNTRGVIWVADTQGDFTNPPQVLPFVNVFASDGVQSTFSSASGVARISATEILVVGEAEAGDGTIHAALWRSTNNGVNFSASSLGADHLAYAVNNDRQVVGENDADLSPVMWTVSELGVAAAPVSLGTAGSAVAINENGRAAGWSGASPNATVWTGTAPATLYSTESQAYGLNNDVQPLVVGREGGQGFVKRVN